MNNEDWFCFITVTARPFVGVGRPRFFFVSIKRLFERTSSTISKIKSSLRKTTCLQGRRNEILTGGTASQVDPGFLKYCVFLALVTCGKN